jgi:alkane 1-monooxygenase
MPGFLAIAGSLVDPRWYAINIIWNVVILVIADWIFSPRRKAPPAYTSSVVPDFILYTASLLHIVSIILLIKTAVSGYFLSTSEWISAMLSVGLNAGISGIVVGHELIHRRKAMERYIGQLNMLMVNYLHFYIEHVRGHHKRVGTSADPATARYGESIYAFIARTVPGQWRSALEIEAERIRSSGKKRAYGLQNYVIRALFIQLVILLTLYFTLGWLSLTTHLGQSLVAIFLLEYVNYIEHYGLVREEGRKVEAVHAWQSDAPSSRLTLVELSRHADHHIKASKPYHTLESHKESPELNSGYFGMFYIALIPPLWFAVVHKRMREAGI